MAEDLFTAKVRENDKAFHPWKYLMANTPEEMRQWRRRERDDGNSADYSFENDDKGAMAEQIFHDDGDLEALWNESRQDGRLHRDPKEGPAVDGWLLWSNGDLRGIQETWIHGELIERTHTIQTWDEGGRERTEITQTYRNGELLRNAERHTTDGVPMFEDRIWHRDGKPYLKEQVALGTRDFIISQQIFRDGERSVIDDEWHLMTDQEKSEAASWKKAMAQPVPAVEKTPLAGFAKGNPNFGRGDMAQRGYEEIQRDGQARAWLEKHETPKAPAPARDPFTQDAPAQPARVRSK